MLMGRAYQPGGSVCYRGGETQLTVDRPISSLSANTGVEYYTSSSCVGILRWGGGISWGSYP